jgi:hypothetical protein
MMAFPRGPADLLDGGPGGLGELVDVGAGARSGGLRRDGGDDLAVVHRRDPGDGDHRDGGLAAAGHHVHVRRVQVLVEVDRGDRVRADGGGRQVDQLLAERRQDGRVRDVCLGRGGVENDLDLAETGELDGPVDAAGGGRDPQPARPGQAVRVRVDAD